VCGACACGLQPWCVGLWGCFCTWVFLFLLVNAMIHSSPVYSCVCVCVCVGVGGGGAVCFNKNFFSFAYKQLLLQYSKLKLKYLTRHKIINIPGAPSILTHICSEFHPFMALESLEPS